jgi:hypothetical protein
MPVHDTNHNHLVANQGEVQTVGKSRDQSSTLVAMNLGKAEGRIPNSGQNLVERHTKLAAKPGAAVFVPSLCIEPLPLSLRAEDDRSTHRPPLRPRILIE